MLAMYEREVLVYFVASVLCRGNLPAYFTTTSTFMAIKLLFEPLVYSNVSLSLLFSFAFKICKRSKWKHFLFSSCLWSYVQDFALTVQYRSFKGLITYYLTVSVCGMISVFPPVLYICTLCALLNKGLCQKPRTTFNVKNILHSG